MVIPIAFQAERREFKLDHFGLRACDYFEIYARNIFFIYRELYGETKYWKPVCICKAIS